MSTETNAAARPYDELELVGPRLEDDSFYVNYPDEAVMPHSGNAGLEFPANEFGSTKLKDAHSKGFLNPNAPESTEGLPSELQNVKKSRRRLIMGVAGATALAVAVGVGAKLGSNDEREPQQSRPTATAPATPGATPTETVATSQGIETAPGLPSRENVAERLNIPASMLNTEYLSSISLEKNPAELEAILNKYDVLNPQLRIDFLTTRSVMEGEFLKLPVSDFLDAQEGFSSVLGQTMYDTEALQKGNVVKTTAGEYFTQTGNEPFPYGVLTGERLRSFITSETSIGHRAESVVAQDVFNAARMPAQLAWAAQNLAAMNKYDTEHSKEALQLDFTPGALAELSYFKSVNADTAIIRNLSTAEKGGLPGANTTDSYIVKLLERKGATSADPTLYGLISAYVQGTNLVVEAVGFVPLSGSMAYKDGKPVTETVVQPVILSTQTLNLRP